MFVGYSLRTEILAQHFCGDVEAVSPQEMLRASRDD
jgi:hypothetical protein